MTTSSFAPRSKQHWALAVFVLGDGVLRGSRITASLEFHCSVGEGVLGAGGKEKGGKLFPQRDVDSSIENFCVGVNILPFEATSGGHYL